MGVIGFKKSVVLLFVFAFSFLIASLHALEVQTPGSSFFKTKLTRVSSVIDLGFSNSVTKLDFLLEWSDKVEPVLINTVAYEIESKYEGKTLAPISTKGKSFAPVEGTKSLPFVINLPYLKRGKADTFSIQGKIKAIIPEDFEQIASGTGAIEIYGKNRKILEGLIDSITFLKDESCGKCTPCREGTYRIAELLNKLIAAASLWDRKEILELISIVAKTAEVSSFCPLGASINRPVSSAIDNFKQEILGE